MPERALRLMIKLAVHKLTSISLKNKMPERALRHN